MFLYVGVFIHCWMFLLDVFICWSFCTLLDIDNALVILPRKKHKY